MYMYIHINLVPLSGTLYCIYYWDQTPIEGTSVVLSLLEGEMSRIWYQNDQKYPNSLNQ